MLIYRLETPNGKGPYQTDIFAGSSIARNSNLHPTPDEDIPGFQDLYLKRDSSGKMKGFNFEVAEEYYFGFESMKSFHSWFDPIMHVKGILERSINFELKLLIYNIQKSKKNVMFGSKQIAFLKKKAKIVQEEHLEKVYRNHSVFTF